MIATIVCGLIIIFCIVGIAIMAYQWFESLYDDGSFSGIICAFLCVIGVGIIFLVLSLMIGYYNVDSDAKREFEKNEIVKMLEEGPNEYNVGLAEEHNKKEKQGNNYWCRFTLREEYLIDIKSYLYNGNKGDKMDGIANSDCKFYDFGKQYIELKEGSIVEVIGKSEDYYVVRWNGTTGLIDKKYIDLQE